MVTIAVVQYEIAQFMPGTNLLRMEDFIKEAVAAHADLIVFPEDAITGPVQGNKQFVDYEGMYVQHFQQLARHYAIDIVPGSLVEGDASGWYNTTYYIEHTGTIKGSYRKVNLWHPERLYLAPGDSHPVFETAYGKVGLIICWDLIFPEVFRAMLKQGVEIVICPSYWCFEDAGIGLTHDRNAEITAVNALCVARAFEQEIVLVFVNAASGNGALLEEHLIGRSQVTVPFKGVLHRADHNQEAMFVTSVDTAILRDAESAYKIRDDLRKGLHGE